MLASGIKLRMGSYTIMQIEKGFVVLADGRPQLLFERAEDAEAVVDQVETLGNLPDFRWFVLDFPSSA
jgi:hypothetical protein